MKFDSFVENLSKLVLEIENWISKHTNIIIDLIYNNPHFLDS